MVTFTFSPGELPIFHGTAEHAPRREATSSDAADRGPTLYLPGPDVGPFDEEMAEFPRKNGRELWFIDVYR